MNKSDFAMLHKRKELMRPFHYLYSYRFKTFMLKLKLFKGEISIDCYKKKEKKKMDKEVWKMHNEVCART